MRVRQFKWCDRCRLASDWTVRRGFIVCNACGARHFYTRRGLRATLVGGLIVLTGCLAYVLNH